MVSDLMLDDSKAIVDGEMNASRKTKLQSGIYLLDDLRKRVTALLTECGIRSCRVKNKTIRCRELCY